jgi:hypothetical protein
MLDRNNLEETIKEMARQQGHELNGQDKLIIRPLNSYGFGS